MLPMDAMQYQQFFIVYLKTINNQQRPIYAPDIHLFVKIGTFGTPSFHEFETDSYHTSTKFGTINQAMGLFCVVVVEMKKSDVSDIGKKVDW